MYMCEQWQLHCTSQWGKYMPLSVHVYCVAIAIKMTEQVEQWICIRFCVKLEHPPWKLFGWLRRPHLWATGDWQLHHDNVPTHASHLMQSSRVRYSNHPGDSASLHPRFGALWLLAFPKTKITFEREEIQDHQWVSGIYEEAAGGNWENCVRSQGTYFEGGWGVIIFFSKCLYFSHYMTGYLLDSFACKNTCHIKVN